VKLAEFIKHYVAFRKGRGEKFTTSEGILRRFSHTAGKDLEFGNVTADLVKRFLNGSGPLTRYWHRKYSALRGLFRHAVAHGHISVWPLPAIMPKEPPDFVPYIYSEDELRRMLHGISSVIYQKRKMLLEPHTFRAILLLLYGTGLRIGEATSLRLADVDLKKALIVVGETKFYKSRFVPLGPELNGAMLEYTRKRNKGGHPHVKAK
jgi:integrase/recombinase XerD